jgi:hypothetical protein
MNMDTIFIITHQNAILEINRQILMSHIVSVCIFDWNFIEMLNWYLVLKNIPFSFF